MENPAVHTVVIGQPNLAPRNRSKSRARGEGHQSLVSDGAIRSR